MGQVQEPLGRVNHGKWLNVGVREWAAAKMLLDQSKVDAGGGGKDRMDRFIWVRKNGSLLFARVRLATERELGFMGAPGLGRSIA